MLTAALCESLSEPFAELPDPHSARNRRHELGDSLTLLLKQDSSIRLGIKNQRNRAGWDMDYLLHLLSLAQPA